MNLDIYHRFGGRHLEIPTFPYPGQYRQWSLWYPGPRKCGDSRWNFVPRCHRTRATLLYINYECRYICHRFGGRHFGIPGRTGIAKNVPFCSPIIFRKSHQSVPVNSERFRNGSEKIGLGVILPSPLSTWGLKQILCNSELSDVMDITVLQLHYYKNASLDPHLGVRASEFVLLLIRLWASSLHHRTTMQHLKC